jgi:hypothetical protein
LSKRWNVISFRSTADTLHVHVHVAFIEKGKIFFYVHYNNIVNFQVLRRYWKGSEIFYTTVLSTFLHMISCV